MKCKNNKMEDSPVRFRYLLAVMCVAECLLLGGLNYGWGSLVFVLKLEGFFLDVCPGNNSVGSLSNFSRQIELCEERELQFSFLFVVTFVLQGLTPFLMGRLHIGVGTRIARLITTAMLFLGLILATLATVESPWPLYPGLSLMGAGGLSLYCLDHQVAQLFPKGGLVFVALAAGSLDTSAGMQLLVKLLYEAGVSRRACYIGLAALCLLPLLTTFLLFPKGFVRPVLDTTDNSGQGEEGTGDGQSSKSRPRDKSGHDNASYTKDGEEFSLGSGQQWPVKVYSSGVESLAKSGNEVLSQTSYSDILPKHNETGEGDDKGDKPHAVSACIAKPSGDVTHHTKHSDDVPFPTKPSDDVTPDTKSSHDVTHNTGLNGDVAHHTEINGDVTRHTELNDDVTNATSPGTDVTSGLADNVSMRAVFLCPRYLLHMLWCVLGQFAFFAFFSSINMRLEILLDTIQQVSEHTDVLFYIQLTGIPVSLLCGLVYRWSYSLVPANRQGDSRHLLASILPLSLTSSMAVLMWALLAANVSETLYPAFAVVVVFRTFLYSVASSYFSSLFPVRYLSMMVGSLTLSSSVVSMLQYAMVIWAENDGQVQTSIFCVCLGVVTYVHPLYIWCTRHRTSQTEGANQTCGIETDLNSKVDSANQIIPTTKVET